MLSFVHGNDRLQHGALLDLSRNISKIFGLDFGSEQYPVGQFLTPESTFLLHSCPEIRWTQAALRIWNWSLNVLYLSGECPPRGVPAVVRAAEQCARDRVPLRDAGLARCARFGPDRFWATALPGIQCVCARGWDQRAGCPRSLPWFSPEDAEDHLWWLSHRGVSYWNGFVVTETGGGVWMPLSVQSLLTNQSRQNGLCDHFVLSEQRVFIFLAASD